MNIASPDVIVFWRGFKPMIERQVTLFPQPDSPTIASVLPLLDRERQPVDRLDEAVVGLEGRLQVTDVEQGHATEV